MNRNFRLAGSGGQGIIMLSVMLANAYGLYEGYEVAQTQTYGSQARGGTSQAFLKISDSTIGDIKVENADVFVAFNEVSYNKFISKTTENSIVFVDSTLIRPEIYSDCSRTVYAFDATRVAEEQYKPVMVNVLMMGFMASKLGDVSLDSLEKVICRQVPEKFAAQNIAALHTGYDAGCD